MSIRKVVIVLLVLFLGVLYYLLASNLESYSITAKVVRIVDGDTVEIEGAHKVRLLGINTPEKSFKFSNEAAEFLEELVLEKKVQIEIKGTDKYGRFLGYVFVEGVNINEEILQDGFATLYYYEKDEYYDDLRRAEEEARNSGKGLWAFSPKKDCVKLVRLTYEEVPERCTGTEELVLENICDEDLDVVIKDDATHIYEETLIANSIFSKNFSCIWNDAGDSVYVADETGMVLFWRYG